MLPLASQATATTRKPAVTALAGFVPWAETGIRHTSRLPVAAALVVAADGEQARVFALRAGVRLQGHRGEAGDLGQPLLELGEQLRVAPGLLGGREGVQRANSGQVTGSISLVAFSFIVQEPSGIIEVVEREVLGLQPVDVAEHLVLRVVGAEDLVGEERAAAREGAGQLGGLSLRELAGAEAAAACPRTPRSRASSSSARTVSSSATPTEPSS